MHRDTNSDNAAMTKFQIANPRRCAISFFYDPDGVVDDYLVYLLKSIRPFCTTILFVVNGELNAASRSKVAEIADEIIERDNNGFDVHAYKAGLEHIWARYKDSFDEVLMFNHTFFGPLYPLSEMFDAMSATECDFWGITAHKAEAARPENGHKEIPYHLNSHFIAVREPMLSSAEFHDYWQTMRPIRSYWESIEHHELRFTKHFSEAGFLCSSYIDSEKFGSSYAAFMEVDATIEARSPLLKRRVFFHDSDFLDERATDLPRALRLVAAKTDYDTSMIWRNIVRSTPARTMNTNAARLRVLPNIPLEHDEGFKHKQPRIALCVHAYYAELIDEILDYAKSIPFAFDLVVTTNTDEKKAYIEAAAAKRDGIGKIIVRIWQERGRDMSALLVACHDLFEGDEYDLVCRVHTKKSPQVEASKGNFFKRFVLENTLGGAGYVQRLLSLFENDPSLGIVMPPMMHISVPTLGHSWFINKQKTVDIAKQLGLKVPIDEISPVAVYGGMFWFRPKALRKLFKANYKYADFEPEPLAIDGTLPHALERIIVYVAQDAGYTSMTASLPEHIEHAYSMLEYKANELTHRLPTGDFRRQINILDQAQNALWDIHIGAADQSDNGSRSSVSELRKECENALAMVRHFKTRVDRTARGTRKTLPLPGGAKFLLLPKDVRYDAQRIWSYLSKMSRLSDGRLRMPHNDEIIDYLFRGYLDHRDIFTFFDSSFYFESNSDVVKAGANPLSHFHSHGFREGRSPHPLVDVKFIQERHREVIDYNIPLSFLADPIVNKTFSPHPLFDTAYYIAQTGVEALGDMSPIEHYLTTGSEANINPHPYFDQAFYRRHSPELELFGISPLVHYIRYGALEGRQPSAKFDGAGYLKRNPDVRRHKLNPLIHYLQSGRFEGRSPA